MKKIFISFVLAVFLITNFIGAAFSENTPNNVDFGPYMREVQRSIKSNWEPPKGGKTNTVIVRYKINKDGTCPSVKIFKSSGIKDYDDAAIKAVQKTAPFKPLPAEFKGNDVEIQFQFDYNVRRVPKSNFTPSSNNSKPAPNANLNPDIGPDLDPIPVPDAEDISARMLRFKIEFMAIIGLCVFSLILIILAFLTVCNNKNDKNKGL